MSAHPNALLIIIMKPDDLPTKTMRAIREDNTDEDNDSNFTVGHIDVSTKVMEEDYLESEQIEANVGDLLFYTYLTYGYGHSVAWPTVRGTVIWMEKWAKETAAKHHCSYEIRIGANFW